MKNGLIATWTPFEALIGRAENALENNSYHSASNSELTTPVTSECPPGTGEIQISLYPPFPKGD